MGSSSTIGESTGSGKAFLSARSQADPFLDNRLPSYYHGSRTEEERMAEQAIEVDALHTLCCGHKIPAPDRCVCYEKRPSEEDRTESELGGED